MIFFFCAGVLTAHSADHVFIHHGFMVFMGMAIIMVMVMVEVMFFMVVVKVALGAAPRFQG